MSCGDFQEIAVGGGWSDGVQPRSVVRLGMLPNDFD